MPTNIPVALAALALPAAVASGFVVPPAPLAAAPYAQWAHSHFVWEEGSPNASVCAALVAGYIARNISVGAVDVDSGWSTGYDNFVVAPAFGDLAGFVAAMHALDVNVILWATALINTDSPNYAEGLSRGFFLRDFSNATALVDWWHGRGAFLDYGNEDALAWWEAAMAGPLSAGVDGWKVDGIDPFIVEVLGPTSRAGPITLQQYQNWTAGTSEQATPQPTTTTPLTLAPTRRRMRRPFWLSAQYGHFFNHTRAVRGPSALIWSRPVDSYPIALNISAFLTFSPKYVMFSGWVGDQDPTFAGLRDALVNIFASAWNNCMYQTPSATTHPPLALTRLQSRPSRPNLSPEPDTNFGSDTGGYRGASPPRTSEEFLRWAQTNAFLPLFENGGDDDHTPWWFDATYGSGTFVVSF